MNKENERKFGYPLSCNKCGGDCKWREDGTNLKDVSEIAPFYEEGKGLKLMIIGQDPMIAKNPGKVKSVLMLKEKNSQLRRWLENEVLIKKEYFDNAEIYATNLVKCQTHGLPAKSASATLDLLTRRFAKCKEHLENEIQSFEPNLVLTLGEPAHKLFLKELETVDDNSPFPAGSMKEDFNGTFFRVKMKGVEFDYSPCLHIQTYRVADNYGKPLQNFKSALEERLGCCGKNKPDV